MTLDNRQKGMLVVLGVLILGMGGWWFVFRDSGGSQALERVTGTVEKKTREVAEKTDTKRTRERPTRDTEASVGEKRTRDPYEETRAKKTRTRAPKSKEKKKDVIPAA